jgi:hypothetical protein
VVPISFLSSLFENLRDFEAIKILQKQILEITTMIYLVSKYTSIYLKGLKGAASLIGICNEYMASPLTTFKEKEMSQFRNGLDYIQAKMQNMELL